jgi:gluconate 2-dehydrogenase subunit 3-like protein
MSEITRRDVLRRLGLVLVTVGYVDRVSAQEVHQMAAQAQTATGGAYAPTALTAHEYATLERLTDLIIPVENGAPGAVAAGAAAWIDMLTGASDQLKTTYTTGLAWLDTAMKNRGAADFLTATAAEQTALLDATRPRSSRPESSFSAGHAG